MFESDYTFTSDVLDDTKNRSAERRKGNPWPAEFRVAERDIYPKKNWGENVMDMISGKLTIQESELWMPEEIS